MAPDGRIVLADPGEARISLFSSEGKRAGTFGRRGEGPTEFQVPVNPRIDQWGRVHVVDIRTRRVSVFSVDGDLYRSFRTPADFQVTAFELADGGYWLAGVTHGGGPGPSLLRLDSLGNGAVPLSWIGEH